MLEFAIITQSKNGSPRVLAQTLHNFITDSGYGSEVFYKDRALNRLFNYKQVGKNIFIWGLYKLWYAIGDKLFFNKLKTKDVVIHCGTSPLAFYKDSYHIQKLKKLINKPIVYYAVQYLQNSPTIVEKLKKGGHDLLDRYDWHLAVSPVTEIKSIPTQQWNQIGLYLKSTGLKPEIKESFFAVVDFEREGYEHYRKVQIQVLEELNIPYLSLEKHYSLDNIRNIYRNASLFFIQFPEAYGLPIAECLACGSYICTPDSSWPMSWRLDEEPQVHGPGTLPECFIVYDGYNDLKKQLGDLKNNYDVVETPKNVFNTFLQNYRSFYEGNPDALHSFINSIASVK